MRKEIIFVTALTFLFFMLSGCAPKKIKVYESSEALRQRILDLSLTLLGKPYFPAGKGPEKFDCSGLVYYVYRSVNINLPLSTEELMRSGMEVSRQNLLPGDLVFFKIQKDLHVGIMINKDEFIHASKSKGVTIDTLNSLYWRRHLLAFRSVIF